MYLLKTHMREICISEFFYVKITPLLPWFIPKSHWTWSRLCQDIKKIISIRINSVNGAHMFARKIGKRLKKVFLLIFLPIWVFLSLFFIFFFLKSSEMVYSPVLLCIGLLYLAHIEWHWFWDSIGNDSAQYSPCIHRLNYCTFCTARLRWTKLSLHSWLFYVLNMHSLLN